MFDNEEDDYAEGAFQEDLERFEHMLRTGSAEFFDSDRLEMMLDHFMMSNQFKKALECVEHALYHFPTQPIFKVRKAQVLSASGKLNEALKMLMSVEKLVGNDQEYLLSCASVFSQLRDTKNAIRYFERALEQSEGEEKDEIFLDLAMEYQAAGDLDSSVRILNLAILHNPDNETAVYELAYCYDLLGKTDDAIACYEKYIDVNPYSFTTWYNLGNAYSKAENYEKAAWAYDYCILINENFSSAYFNLGNTYISMNKYRSAIEAFEKCLDLDGDDGITLDYIAEAYEQLGEYDLALLYYKRSMDLAPELPDPWLGTGIVLDLMGKTAEGIHFIRKAALMEPENADYWHVLAGCAGKLGLVDEVKDALLKGLLLAPDNDEILCDYSRILAVDSMDEAIHVMESYGDQSEEKGLSRLLLVKFYWLTGRQSDSLFLYRELVMFHPELARQLYEQFEEAAVIPQFLQLYELLDN
jgi:tetratricopeptide (TPR) repeat protein